MLQGAELLEFLGLFQWSGLPADELLEEIAAKTVEANVPERLIGRVSVPIKRNGTAGKIEGAAVAGSDHLDVVGIGEARRVGKRAGSGDHVEFWVLLERADQSVNEPGIDGRFVALHV